MQQFDVYAPPSGPLVVIIQGDLLGDMRTRVAIPLLDVKAALPELNALNPTFDLGEVRVVLAPQFVATFTRRELGTRVGSLEHERDRIIHAVDVLMGGI
ncbi:MAG: CcdB family protein [Pseudomonadota bacterium]